ncbi:MAG: hypothetical protein JNL52_05685 [Flavobacteriales bacterium]|nr:hypothetical protein [Flavobacteriales bacterium]
MAEEAPIYPVRIASMASIEMYSNGLNVLLMKVPGADFVLATTQGNDLLAALDKGLQVDVVFVLVTPKDQGEMQLLRTLRARYPQLILVAMLYEPELDHFDAEFDGGATKAIPVIDLTAPRLHRLVKEVRAELMARNGTRS